MRISDWSSDVCSSDLLCLLVLDLHFLKLLQVTQLEVKDPFSLRIRQRKDADQFCLGIVLEANDADHLVDVEVGDQQAFEDVQEIGRASCRERVCQYV